MKNILGIFIAVMGMMALASCDPIENRQVMTGAVTEADVKKYVKIESIQRESEITPGKMVNSNFINITSDGLAPCVTSFTYGIGTYVGTNISNLQAFVVASPEPQTVWVNVLNADGTVPSWSPVAYPILVEEAFDVAPQWAYFCGDGEKVWSWDPNAPAVWGNGGYLGNTAPGWWAVSPDDNATLDNQGGGHEGIGATMTFSANGSTLTLKRNDGSTTQGTFRFDMSKIKGADGKFLTDEQLADSDVVADAWSIGQFYTSAVTVLLGINVNANGAPFYTYDIMNLDDNHLGLAAPDDASTGAWGEAWFWVFAPVQ